VLPALRLAMIERLHRSCPELTTPSHHLLAEVIGQDKGVDSTLF